MADPEHIATWRRIDDRLTTSGQPSEAELAEIAALGVTRVVNLGLHSHEKALPDEAASVAALGMTYTHLPVDFEQPAQADFDRFCAVMTDVAGERVHVHCIANLRVSAFLYRYDRDVRGVAEAEARRTMDTIWRPGGAWAAFIGDEDSVALPHRAAKPADGK